MSIRTGTLTIILIVIAGITALNWTLFNESTELNFIVASVEVPLGLTLVIALLVTTLVYLVFLAGVESNLVKMALELEKARLLASDAENSRVADLHDYMRKELEALNSRLSAVAPEVETAQQPALG